MLRHLVGPEVTDNIKRFIANTEPDLNNIEILFLIPHSLNYLWKNFKLIHDGSLVEVNQANISLVV